MTSCAIRKSRGHTLASSLTIAGIHAAYGAVRVIEDVSLNIGGGETVVLLGTNGNGKSTLMKCIMGIVQPSEGSIIAEIDGINHDLVGRTTEEIVDLGIALVPEGRRLFPKLTVEENLLLGAYRRTARRELARNLDVCFETFPQLAERRAQLAGSMSGGEQQMLALGRALMLAPKILLVDEPSVGTRADPREPHYRSDRRNEKTLQSYSADGGAEFHASDPHRRPRVCDRAWKNRLRRRLRRRAQQQRFDQEVLSGIVSLFVTAWPQHV